MLLLCGYAPSSIPTTMVSKRTTRPQASPACSDMLPLLCANMWGWYVRVCIRERQRERECVCAPLLVFFTARRCANLEGWRERERKAIGQVEDTHTHTHKTQHSLQVTGSTVCVCVLGGGGGAHMRRYMLLCGRTLCRVTTARRPSRRAFPEPLPGRDDPERRARHRGHTHICMFTYTHRHTDTDTHGRRHRHECARKL